jgi:wyosine [tRNA(Phe)-imidazoG37] synthetase (radical SAM superfamily)
MMIDGINDAPAETGQILNYLKKLQPDISYIAIPTRPPADRNIKPANSQSVLSTYHLFNDNLKRVELLTAYEGNNFKSISNIHDDILDIAAVHPIRSDALQKMLQDTHTDWTLIYNMINKGELIKYDYQGYNYYLKAL